MDLHKLSRIQDNWVDLLKAVLKKEDTPSTRKSLTQSEMVKESREIADIQRDCAREINKVLAMSDPKIDAKATWTYDIFGGMILVSVKELKYASYATEVAEAYGAIKVSGYNKDSLGGKDYYTAYFVTQEYVDFKDTHKLVDSSVNK